MTDVVTGFPAISGWQFASDDTLQRLDQTNSNGLVSNMFDDPKPDLEQLEHQLQNTGTL